MPKRADDLGHFAGAEQRVDLGNLILQFVPVSLGEAPGDHQPLARAGLLQLRHLEDGVDGFLLGLVDERARVDDEDVGLARIGGERVPGLLGQPQHHLGVDEVLGAAEGDHSDFH